LKANLQKDYALIEAGVAGHVTVCEWIYNHSRRNPYWEYYFLDSVCKAQAVNLECLKWGHSKGWRLPDALVCKLAKSGNLEALKWAVEHGANMGQYTASHAAASGNLELLKWVLDNGCSRDDINICVLAAHEGHFAVLKWAIDNGCPFDNPGITAYCTRSENFDMLKYVIEKGGVWDDTILSSIIDTSNVTFEILEWAKYNGCPVTTFAMETAVRLGKLEIKNWLERNGVSVPSSIPDQAVLSENPRVLEWVLSLGFEFPQETFYLAVTQGNLTVLEWLKENAKIYPLDRATRKQLFAKMYDGNTELFEWLWKNSALGNWSVEDTASLIERQDWKLVKWVVEKKLPLSDNVLNKVTERGYPKLVQWAQDNIYAFTLW